jgi:hypothetical protein
MRLGTMGWRIAVVFACADLFDIGVIPSPYQGLGTDQ